MNNILVVYKKSFFEIYSSSPDKEVRDFVNKQDEDAERMRRSHDEQQRTLETVVDVLDREGIKHKEVYRANMKDVAEEVENNYLVVSIGGDGTFLEVSHYVTKVPILGVNSDTNKNGSVGFFCTANRGNFVEIIKRIETTPRTSLSRLEIILDGQRIPELALNDILVANTNPAAITRYRLQAGGETREYKSSGLLVCTAAGSTAWMYQEGGLVTPVSSVQAQYLSRGVRGEKSAFADELKVKSLTRECRIYVDGQHIVYEFGLGSILDVRKGAPLTVVGDLEAKRSEYV